MHTIIFRPTNQCNLRCTYCYDKNNHDTSIKKIKAQSTETFKREMPHLISAVNTLFQEEEHPCIIFHGGEPLLVDSKVLDEFCSEIQKKNNLEFCIQTNGTLINKEVIEFFKKYNFNVGISLDGYNPSQNVARVFPNGKNSFATVFKKIKLLQEEEIDFGLIMSLTKAHKGKEQELYNFIADNDLACNIRPVFPSDKEAEKQVLSPEEYVTFFNNLFDIWFDDSEEKVETHQIYELYSNLREVLDDDYLDKLCTNSPNCFENFISLDVYSNLYACNRLYGIKQFYYGNLKNDSLESIRKKMAMLQRQRNQAIEGNCGSCERFSKCNGGCPAESYELYKSIEYPTIDCEPKKKILMYVKERVL